MTPRKTAHLALLVVAIIYGVNYIVAKEVMPQYILPRGFIFMRVIGASLLFFLLSFFVKSEKKIERKDWFRVLLCGFFGVTANQLLFFEGLNLTTPINAAVIMTVTPVMVLIMSAILLREVMGKWRILGVIVGALGAVILIMGTGEISLFNRDTEFGNLLVFLNAATYAVYLVIVKPLMRKYDALLVIKWIFAAGVLFVIPFGIGQFSEIEWATFTPAIVVQVIFVVVVTTFLAYLFNIYALKTLTSSTVSIYIYLQPLFATIIALLLAKDTLTFRTIIAAALIFTGVYLVSFKKPGTYLKPKKEEPISVK